MERGFWSPKAVSGSPLCRDINHESDCADLGLVTKPGLWGKLPQVKPLMGRGRGSSRLCGPCDSSGRNILSCQAHGEGGRGRTHPAPSHLMVSFFFWNKLPTLLPMNRHQQTFLFTKKEGWAIQTTTLVVGVGTWGWAFILPLSSVHEARGRGD